MNSSNSLSIGKDKLEENLSKYEELRLQAEKQNRSNLFQKGIRRMAHDYMKKLTENHGPEATKLPLQLKMNTIAQQLLMNEMEICYWHTLNQSNEALWSSKPNIVMQKVQANALFAKINSSTNEHAEIFKTFILHNYKEMMQAQWKDYATFPLGDQQNWLRYVYPDEVSGFIGN